MSGKKQGKVREFEVDDKWQPRAHHELPCLDICCLQLQLVSFFLLFQCLSLEKM